ncbi:hypothetical protein EZV73_11080 [Acidaminobacter sp. JC074]|uniref:ATP-binding protein n=1 Tax=Acidaminobacter sp. JC074 TaxID=2530199 RepID=UPI001F0E462C|nr:ATP-binding protein [Acidaminobacter sp. JC074]MCH4888119.1 hypothetical protein [Acidaminobacter sp. JC074]
MSRYRRVLVFFILFICFIYLYGIFYEWNYQMHTEDLNTLILDKASFYDVIDDNKNIENRELSLDEEKLHVYKYNFDKSILRQLSLNKNKNENIYLMIEKPDAQYVEVQLNDRTIGTFGSFNGRANIWNGTIFAIFNEDLLHESNELTIMMKSDYMTGVSGDIVFMTDVEYNELSSLVSSGMSLIEMASNIAFIVAVIIFLMIIAWKDELYNKRVYIYFMISIIALGISLYDYRLTSLLPFDYLIFKKITVVSYHVSITFAALAISHMLNAKIKFNLGMVGLALILYKVFTTTNMVAWRDSYQVLNLFLIAAILQLVFTLVYYRRRAATSALLLIIAFSLAGVSIVKLVYITSTAKASGFLIDMPVLVVMYASVVLFVFYFEMLQMASDQDVDLENSLSLTGTFTIDKHLKVVGQYSNTCNAIFDRLIVGAHLGDLLFENELDFVEDIFTNIFDNKFDFIDGFLDLLPTETSINYREYVIAYRVYDRAERFVRITLNDVTLSKALEREIHDQKEMQRFFINALKSKNELSYFIRKTQRFLEILRLEGFTEENKVELHTLKGNLGQFGFIQFERTVHQIETTLEHDYDASELIDRMKIALLDAIRMLERHVGKDYFNTSYQEYAIKKSEIIELEKLYLENHQVNKDFLSAIKRLKSINLKKMISRYNNYVERLSNELGKAVLPFDITGQDVMVQPEAAENLVLSMVGIIRNSLTHGIEEPEERVDKKKDSYGHLECNLAIENETLIITFSDDGRGIDPIIIRMHALELGLISDEDDISDEDLINLVYSKRLTTNDEADMVSGRGVGLIGLFDSVSQLGGIIKVKTEIDKGTDIILTIPIDRLKD